MSIEPRPLTLAEFIAWEERQRGKHEFRADAPYARAGATDDHNQIVANLTAIIRPALRGGRCRVYASHMMLLSEQPAARYPDLLVTCDPRDAVQRRHKRHPKLIIEVLSESTAGIDASISSPNIKRSPSSKNTCSSTRVRLQSGSIARAANSRQPRRQRSRAICM